MTINVYQTGTRYQFAPSLAVGGDDELMKGNAAPASDTAKQSSLDARYALLRWTIMYLEGVYQKESLAMTIQWHRPV